MIEQRVPSHVGSLQARRTPLDPGMRRMIFGPIRPMERPGFLQRLLGR
jgi:hypothetical protein